MFCASKDIIKKIDRHITKGEKISLKYISDKELISTIYKSLTGLRTL